LNAIKNTGNLFHYIHIDIESYNYEKFIKNLLNDIMSFKPDFVLTINHLGFDKEGKLTELFSEMEIPFASWFVDSPNVVLSSFHNNISDYCNLFVWDDDYIPQLKEIGYKHCDYLPLATDTSIFYPKEMRQIYNVSFVGSSMVYTVHKNMQSWCHRTDLIQAFPVVVERFLKSKSRHVEPALDGLRNPFDNIEQEEDFKAAVLWKATQEYRMSGIEKLASFIPTISGDPSWVNIMPIEYEVLNERWYYDNLCDFYNQSVINFNMTSLQMTNAINQRVFDVSACKKFILTDYKKQINDFFETKDSLVWFNSVEEIPDLLEYYLKNESERNKKASCAYDIVTKNHTYKHRIIKLIDIIRKRYK
jgi:spore maturation protein CgeB